MKTSSLHGVIVDGPTIARRREVVLKVVALSHKDGTTQKARIGHFCLSQSTVYRWKRAYAAHGIAGLIPQKMLPPEFAR